MDEFKNQEVFIVAGAEDEETGELFVTNERMALDEFLLTKNPAIDDEVRVFHGILTLAEFLPPSFKNRSVFVVCTHPDDPTTGFVVEAAGTPQEVGEEIETLIQSASPIVLGDLTIDHLYLLYGYQLELGMAINEDDVDEEYIFACELIADETSEVEEQTLSRGE